MWDTHKAEIKRLTGVTTKEEYLKNPQAQELYQNHLGKQYKANIIKLRENYGGLPKVEDETLMLLEHYLGDADANVYIKTLSETKDYDKAQAALDASIKNRTGKLPKNLPVLTYLNKFNTELERVKNSKKPTF